MTISTYLPTPFEVGERRLQQSFFKVNLAGVKKGHHLHSSLCFVKNCSTFGKIKSFSFLLKT